MLFRSDSGIFLFVGCVGRKTFISARGQIVVDGLQVGAAQTVAARRWGGECGQCAPGTQVENGVSGTVNETYFVATSVRGRGVTVCTAQYIAAETEIAVRQTHLS